jgi:hypothetical protein
MRRIPVALAIVLLVPAAAADASPPLPGIPPPPAPVRVAFYTVGSNLSPVTTNRRLGNSPPRNRIVIARSRKQAKGWAEVLAPTDQATVREFYFPRNALVGVFFHRGDAQALSVTGMWVNRGTLELSLRLVPWPVLVCIPFLMNNGGCPWDAVFAQHSVASYPYALMLVDKESLAAVRRVVVTKELYDPPQVINISPQ